MDSKLKQRLTGAVILTSLAIILLPLLLDGTPEGRQSVVNTEIPEPPRIELGDISVQSVERQIQEMERASEARMPREIADETDYQEAEDFSLDQNQLPVNWSLQLGSFQKEENATRLRKLLREQAYRAYILHAVTSDGEIYRVFVGPSSSKEALEEMNVKIEQSLKLKGRVVRYRIEEDKEQLGG